MPRRLDRRVQRTRKMLRESLMSLIMEEGYDEISIQDITDKANLGRATFYLHFKDKDELLLEVMSQLMGDILDQVPQLSETQWQLDDTKAIIKLFEFAMEHYDLYRILTIGSGAITAGRQLQTTIAENIRESIQSEMTAQNTEPTVPVDFIANFMAGSLLATIYWWLDHDLPYTVEEMADMYQKVNQLERDSLLGFDKLDPETEQEDGKKKKRGREKDNNNQPKKEPEGSPEMNDNETNSKAEEED